MDSGTHLFDLGGVVDTAVDPNGDTAPSLLLDRAAIRVSSAVQAALRHSDLTLEKWRILDLLADREGMTMREIADAVVVTGPTLTRIVDNLATEALVHRAADALDRRRVLVALTPRGHRLRAALRPAVREAENAALSALTTDQLTMLAELLTRLSGPHATETTSR